jgi:glycosyltransferase involved in cell wall biosynthesis
MKRLVVLDMWRGAARGPSKSVLYTALNAHFDIRLVSAEPPLQLKVSKYVKTFHPRLARWKARVASFKETAYKHPSMFRLFTRLYNQELLKITEDYDALLQIGSLFGPVGVRGCVPYFSYHDSTVRNPELMWKKWIPPDFDTYRQEWYTLEKNMLLSTSAILTYSSYVKSTMVEHYGLPSDRVHIVGSALKIPGEYEIEWKERLHDVLFVSTDFERKGGGRLLDIFERVVREVPGARLNIVGHFPPDVRNDTRPWLRLLGPVSTPILIDIYKRTSVLLHPALYDPFPSVILEAANFGIPTVASKICGIPDMILNDQTGYTVEKHNIEEFSARLVSLLRDRRRLMEMGSNAKEYVRARFHPDVVAQNIADVIRSHLNASTSRNSRS